MELLPAIDLRRGRVVRLFQGDDGRRTEYELEPLAVLLGYAAAGVRRVHVVDLDAALGEPAQRELLARLVGAVDAPRVQLGGGLRDRESVEWAFSVGCDRVVLTSLLVRDFALFRELVIAWPGRIVAALDVRAGKLCYAGWTAAAERSLADVCAELRALPLAAVLVTDIDRDGAMTGPNLELARGVGRACGAPALLSGGVRSLADLHAAARTPEIAGAIVGRALYERRLDLGAALRACEPGPTGLACRVIPCLDVREGRVVKGVRFENLTDWGDPAEAALRYAEQGADEIVFLDISAAPERRPTDLEWVRRTAEQVFVPLSVGGGVRSVEDARQLLLAGADKVGVNTAAVAEPALLTALAERFGSQCVVLSVDAWRRHGSQRAWEVVTHGGRTATGRDALAWIAEGVERGAGEILLTSIDADGTREGYDLELIERVTNVVSVPVIASGGAGRPDHLAAALRAGAAAVLAASIFHQGTYTVREIKELLAREFPMRLEPSSSTQAQEALP